MRAAPIVLAIALGLGLSAAVQSPAAIHAAAVQKDLANNGIYIVTFAEAPLARYAGGATDPKSHRLLAATTPRVTGAVKLDAHSIESRQYLGYLKDRRAAHLRDASARIGRPLAPQFVYDAVLDGVALALSPSEAEQLRHVPGVVSVHADFKRYATTDAGPQWIHADKIWDGTATSPAPGTRGAGVVIGVIDTGVNRTHPSFSGAGISNPRGHFYGLCASNASLCTNKLIGIYDFTTGAGDAEPNDGSDNVGHGSHTASTAAGAPVDYSIPLPTGAQVRHTQGVANGANLITYKACELTASCVGSWLIAGLNQAVTDGVDVISFSIGGGLDSPWTDEDQLAMLDARAGGAVVVVAAGNDGPNPGSLTSPSNAPWVLSVAAATHNRIFANKLDLAGGATAPPNGGQLVGAAMTGGVGPLPLVHANPVLCDEGSNLTGTAGENKPAAWTSTTYSNMMVVCDRGIYPRVSKSENVFLAGGGGMVLVNQASDGESIVADTHVIPSTHLGYTAGQALLSWLSTGTGHMGTLEGTTITTLDSMGDLLADFSGRGPVSTPAGVLKPDVTAPGVDILAASNIGAGYNIFSGTSMATPHTAGSAALLKAAHPTWGPSEIVSALVTTARPSVRIDDTHMGGPFDEGGGMLDLAKAVRAGLSFDISTSTFHNADPSLGGIPHDLNLPSLVEESCFEQCNLSRTVRDLAGGASWQVSVNVPGAVITPDTTSFTLASNATRTINFGIDVRIAASVGHWVTGTVTLHPSSGGNIPDTVMPVAIFASPGADQPAVALDVPSESGFHDIDMSGLVALPDASFAGTPLVPVTVKEASIHKDTTSSDPFDSLTNGVTYTTFTLPEAPDGSPRAYRVVVDGTSPTAPDIDLYVGQDANGDGKPSADETTCTSAGPTAVEHCEFDVVNPGHGSGAITYWALAQNFTSSGGNDTVRIEAAGVPILADNNTLTVTGPGKLDRLAAARLRLIWNDPSMVTGSLRRGYVIVSATAGSQTTLIPVRLNRTGTTAAAFALQDSVPHTVSLAANTAQDRIYFDVPKNATQVVFTTQATGAIDLYAAHVPYPTTSDPVIPPAPARNLAQAKSTIAGGNETITLNGTAVLPGRWYVTPVNTASSGTPIATTVTATVTAGTAPVPFVGTAFYDPNRSGAGIYINPDQNGYPEIDWYTYDTDGTPTWYLADLNRVVDTGNAGQLWGDLERVSMGSTGKVLTKVGTVSISLVDATDLVFNYNLNGESGSSPMIRLGTHTCPTLSGVNSSTTGLWYPPEHDGIGESLIVNNHDEYYAIYVYDATGNPRWAYAESPLASAPAVDATRTLTATQLTGACPQCTWTDSTAVDIGSFTRNLVQGGVGSIGYNFSFVSPLSGVWNETHPVIRISQAYTCP
jgi:subtilisin family serine protease